MKFKILENLKRRRLLKKYENLDIAHMYPNSLFIKPKNFKEWVAVLKAKREVKKRLKKYTLHFVDGMIKGDN